ncbi:MAG TPA: pitrilysin family protein [Polyangia bacterium]|nr:pitrilysin family protein [Polyangia bacterium]
MVKIDFETFELPNGLTVILHVDRTSPLVAVNLWYHVGSKDEAPGRTGFAHLFEHLMFMGSKHAPYPSFDAIMESWGGHNNGTTSNDRTNYYEIGPKNLLETFLWLEADRLATLAEVITEEELEKQRKVVLNERRQSYENRPYGRGELRIPEVMYPEAHPYHWPTIGSQADLEAASVDDVRNFFERFYRPSNASLAIAGDFEPAEARRLVERYFGWQAKRERPRPPSPPPVSLDGPRAETLTDRVQLPRLRLAWHSPALFSPGDADLDIAAHVLGGGKSSRLYRTLVYDQRIAQDVFAYQGSQLLTSLFQVGLTAKPGHDLDELERATDVELARLASDGPTAAEVDRARNTHLADFYKSLDHLQTRADLLNHYQHLIGDPGGVERDVARYEAATPATVRDAFARVVGAPRFAQRTLPDPNVPNGGAEAEAEADA